MNCQESRRLLQAYADGQLAPDDARHVADHLAACPACSAELQQLGSLHGLISKQGERHAAPEHLRRRIQLAIREQAAAPAMAATTARAVRRKQGWKPSWSWINGGLAAACALALAVVLVLPHQRGGADVLAQEVADSHFRSLLADHLADVASTDQHTVKPWFAGKLDFSPPVYDFAPQGFPLTGGRLDYLDKRTVAALVYRHKHHVLNLFVWPADARASALQAPAMQPAKVEHMSRQGYQLLHWNQGGMQFWLISDMNAADLGGFESLLSAQWAKDEASTR